MSSAALVKVRASGNGIDVGHKDLEIVSPNIPHVQDVGAGLGTISRTDNSNSITVELSITRC